MSAINLDKDITGTIATYLQPENGDKATLEDKVNAILTTAILAKATNNSNSIVQVFEHSAKVDKCPTPYDWLAINIAAVALSAGRGTEMKKMEKLLNDPKITAFDLSNQTSPYKQPRFILFQKATEMACIENKPESLKFLLNHPSYKELIDCNKRFTRLNSYQIRHKNSPFVKKIIQDNFESQYKPEAAKEILRGAAKKCCELDKAECLDTLFQLDRKQWLQSDVCDLHNTSKKHGSESCVKVILDHIDISEPLGWDPHK